MAACRPAAAGRLGGLAQPGAPAEPCGRAVPGARLPVVGPPRIPVVFPTPEEVEPTGPTARRGVRRPDGRARRIHWGAHRLAAATPTAAAGDRVRAAVPQRRGQRAADP